MSKPKQKRRRNEYLRDENRVITDKRCWGCDVMKPVSCFNVNRKLYGDGLTDRCIQCLRKWDFHRTPEQQALVDKRRLIKKKRRRKLVSSVMIDNIINLIQAHLAVEELPTT